MARPKGSSNKDKPFAEALRMELAEAGDNHKALRGIARNLISMAEKDDGFALSAIREIADRLDGKPTQIVDAAVNDERDVSDLSTAEILARTASILAGADNGASGQGASQKQPSDVRKLN